MIVKCILKFSLCVNVNDWIKIIYTLRRVNDFKNFAKLLRLLLGKKKKNDRTIK